MSRDVIESNALGPIGRRLASCALLLVICACNTIRIPETPVYSQGAQPADIAAAIAEKRTPPVDDMTRRKEYILALADAGSDLGLEAGKISKGYRARIENVSAEFRGWTLLGIGSSIAAAALAVASPANATWVAALSGVSAGVGGYQAKVAEDGYSRDAVMVAYDEFREGFAIASREFAAALGNLAAAVEKSPSEWVTVQVQAASAFESLKAVVMFPGVPRAKRPPDDAGEVPVAGTARPPASP